MAFLNENIESRPLWKPMHLQPVFADAPYYGGQVAEELFNNGLCLPSGSNLTNKERDRIRAVVEKFFEYWIVKKESDLGAALSEY